jgi:hypothetical protein
VPAYPPADESRDRRRPAGSYVGDVGTAGGSWWVSGSNDENGPQLTGTAPDEAWHWPSGQAAAVGMLASAAGRGGWPEGRR